MSAWRTRRSLSATTQDPMAVSRGATDERTKPPHATSHATPHARSTQSCANFDVRDFKITLQTHSLTGSQLTKYLSRYSSLQPLYRRSREAHALLSVPLYAPLCVSEVFTPGRVSGVLLCVTESQSHRVTESECSDALARRCVAAGANATHRRLATARSTAAAARDGATQRAPPGPD